MTAYAADKVAWQVAADGDGPLWAEGLAFAPDGDLVIAGTLHGTFHIGAATTITARVLPADPHVGIDFDTDALAIRLAPDGKVRWARSWDTGIQGQLHAATFVDGELWVAGVFRDHIALDDRRLDAGAAFVSGFVTRLDAEGRATRSTLIPSVTDVSAVGAFASLHLFADGATLVVSGKWRAGDRSANAPLSSMHFADEFFVLRWNRLGALPPPTTLAIPTADRYQGLRH